MSDEDKKEKKPRKPRKKKEEKEKDKEDYEMTLEERIKKKGKYLAISRGI